MLVFAMRHALLLLALLLAASTAASAPAPVYREPSSLAQVGRGVRSAARGMMAIRFRPFVANQRVPFLGAFGAAGFPALGPPHSFMSGISNGPFFLAS